MSNQSITQFERDHSEARAGHEADLARMKERQAGWHKILDDLQRAIDESKKLVHPDNEIRADKENK